jgi:hypothetical protein
MTKCLKLSCFPTLPLLLVVEFGIGDMFSYAELAVFYMQMR